MSKQKVTHKNGNKTKLLVYLWQNKWLYLMMLPAIAWVIVFSYIPMGGITVAFKSFNYMKGIFGSPWCGLQNFKFMFMTNAIWKIIFNTIFLNVLFIVTGTLAQLVLALLFCEIKNKMVKKVTQSIAILPHFISWAVIAMFLTGFLNQNGIVNQILEGMGKERLLSKFRQKAALISTFLPVILRRQFSVTICFPVVDVQFQCGDLACGTAYMAAAIRSM